MGNSLCLDVHTGLAPHSHSQSCAGKLVIEVDWNSVRATTHLLGGRSHRFVNRRHN
jgi:hypothetical protein